MNHSEAKTGKQNSAANQLTAGYSKKDPPLLGYVGLIGLFSAVLASFLFFRRRSTLPDRVEVADLLLFGLATQKISRVMTRGRITSPFRAPFTKYEGSGGAGEVEERPRGTGLRKAIAELITCPYCLGTWIASGLICGFVVNQRMTRTIASIFAVSTLADFAQHGYAKVKELSE